MIHMSCVFLLRWWKNLHIPICLHSKSELPSRGSWPRYGLDLLVAACWRALALAKQQAPDKVEDLHRLFRNVPFDFKFFNGTESQNILERANLSESYEAARDYFGLTGLRLIKLVQDVARLHPCVWSSRILWFHVARPKTGCKLGSSQWCLTGVNCSMP